MHGGSKFARRANFKVYERNAAHSPRELERSQRLIVFEPLGYAISQNMVNWNRPMDGEGSKVECVCSPSTLALRETSRAPYGGNIMGFGVVCALLMLMSGFPGPQSPKYAIKTYH